MHVPTSSSHGSVFGRSQEVRSITNNPRNPHNILKSHSVLLLTPPQLNRETFILYNQVLAHQS